tara:strand:+ start:2713 stop:3987 length:1275 start_codon:yes stop_codon:yes gene_type:complete
MKNGAGIILSAPSSNSGKTIITLGLLRALSREGFKIKSAKSGPDYIDTRFHAAASRSECYNLDTWAMHSNQIYNLVNSPLPLIVEGAMGLFDGAPPNGEGSTAHLAKILDLPVILILDVTSQAQSVAAVVLGFMKLDSDIKISGLILNKVGSDKHNRMLISALEPLGIPILGSIYRQTDLEMPSRHLGLVQAQELNNLNMFLEKAADLISKALDIQKILDLMEPIKQPKQSSSIFLDPPAQSIAIANDAAFSFTYPHILKEWKKMGVEISFFSPLQNQAPQEKDLVFLPGGYPELYAEKLANAHNFKNSMKKAKSVYGECGGYMTMGKGIVDAQGKRHEMLDLLNLETSFETRKLNLGYRNLIPNNIWTSELKAHEFHYATTLKAKGKPLFKATDSEGNVLPDMGLINGNFYGSFAHIIGTHIK